MNAVSFGATTSEPATSKVATPNAATPNAARATAVSDEHRQIELSQEQEAVSKLYRRLDELRRRTDDRLLEVHGRGGRGTMQALVERDAAERQTSRRLSQLSASEYGL